MVPYVHGGWNRVYDQTDAHNAYVLTATKDISNEQLEEFVLANEAHKDRLTFIHLGSFLSRVIWVTSARLISEQENAALHGYTLIHRALLKAGDGLKL